MAPPMAPPKAAPIATPMGPPPPKSLPPKTLAPTTAFAVKGATNNNEVKKDSKGGQKTFNVVERWIFDVSSFPMWPDDDDDDDDDGDNAENNNAETVKNNGPEGGDQEMNEADDEEVRVVVNEDSEDSEGDDDDDDDDDEEDEDAINWDDINESLRGALGRLASAAEEMPRLPEGCPFTLAIELRGEASPPIAVNFPFRPQIILHPVTD